MTNTEVLSIVIAIGFGVFSIVGVMISLFLWNRGESNNDRKSHRNELDDLLKDIESLNIRLNKMRSR